jgi:hypothetical protein
MFILVELVNKGLDRAALYGDHLDAQAEFDRLKTSHACEEWTPRQLINEAVGTLRLASNAEDYSVQLLRADIPLRKM